MRYSRLAAQTPPLRHSFVVLQCPDRWPSILNCKTWLHVGPAVRCCWYDHKIGTKTGILSNGSRTSGALHQALADINKNNDVETGQNVLPRPAKHGNRLDNYHWRKLGPYSKKGAPPLSEMSSHCLTNSGTLTIVSDRVFAYRGDRVNLISHKQLQERAKARGRVGAQLR